MYKDILLLLKIFVCILKDSGVPERANILVGTLQVLCLDSFEHQQHTPIGPKAIRTLHQMRSLSGFSAEALDEEKCYGELFRPSSTDRPQSIIPRPTPLVKLLVLEALGFSLRL